MLRLPAIVVPALVLITFVIGCGQPTAVSPEVGASTTSADPSTDPANPDVVVDEAVARLPAQPSAASEGNVLGSVAPAEVFPDPQQPAPPNAVSSGIPADRDTEGVPGGGRLPGAQPGG